MSEIQRRAAVAVIALLVTSSVASAATYGDIDVTIKSEPRGTAIHGYAEIEFLVVNRSTQAQHDVRITHPRSNYGGGSDYLSAVSRTVTVEPGKSVRVAIAYPARLHTDGSSAVVAIDGRNQEEFIRVGSGPSGRYSYSSSRGGSNMIVLYSKSVDPRFPDWVTSRSSATEVVRADQDAKEWSANWLGYTRYDGVVVTADDLRLMPAEARNAIGQYVECGGTLLVIGRDPPLPGQWKLKSDVRDDFSIASPGFGKCFVTYAGDLPGVQKAINHTSLSWRETAAPWRRVRDPNEANRAFPVVDDVGVPVKGLLALMLVFAVIIGPVNLIVLARKKRKLWLFWTVPVISFATCVIVIGYMAVTEGWKGRSRVEAFTVLDENSRRASTLGWTGFYAPLVPRGGLHFSPETEVTYQNGDDPDPYSYSYSSRRRGSSGSALTIDWTKDQHLASGWLTPRVPAHFALRKSELRRERMTISKGADGLPEAVNGLGADLSEFWYLDEGGNLFHADGIPVGERATLKPVPRPTPRIYGNTLREMYTGDWSGLPEHMKVYGPAMLAPRTYLAVLEAAPFLEDGMPGASVRRTRSVVYGILKEGGDGG